MGLLEHTWFRSFQRAIRRYIMVQACVFGWNYENIQQGENAVMSEYEVNSSCTSRIVPWRKAIFRHTGGRKNYKFKLPYFAKVFRLFGISSSWEWAASLYNVWFRASLALVLGLNCKTKQKLQVIWLKLMCIASGQKLLLRIETKCTKKLQLSSGVVSSICLYIVSSCLWNSNRSKSLVGTVSRWSKGSVED